MWHLSHKSVLCVLVLAWLPPVKGHASSVSDLISYEGYTGNYPGYTLKLDERFDYFDETIWEKGDGAVGSESQCRFQQQGVKIEDGYLSLIIRSEPVPASFSYDHQSFKGAYGYSCGELRTKKEKSILYGRIETRMRAPHRSVASGYISSLFTYVHEGSPREWEEIDVELEGIRPDKFQANLIYGIDAASWDATRQWGAFEDKIEIGPVDEWRVFAIEWTPQAIRWHVDGKLYKTLDPQKIAEAGYTAPIPDNLTQVMMNFWIPNDIVQNFFGGNKKDNVYPMVAQYDWVRIYELDGYPLENY